MSLGERLAVGAGLALVLREVRAIIRLNQFLRRSDSAASTDPDVIAVAVVRENPELVRDTIRHIRALQTNARIVLVLPPSDQSGSLLSPLDAELFVSATDSESKGALINDFVRSSHLGDDVFLTIYDADSRPTTVRHRASRSRPVSQQSSIYRPEDPDLAYWAGFAMNQTLWARSYEHNALVDGSCYYLVGHGLTAQLSVLRSQPFREDLPGEDMLLGYQLSLRGVLPAISPGTDIAEISVRATDHMRQGGRWFVGELTALAEVSRVHGPTTLVVRRMAGLAFWLAGPLVVAWIVRVAMRADQGKTRILVCIAAGTRSAMFLRLAHDSRMHGSHPDTPLDGVMAAIGFATKPMLSACAGWWGVLQMMQPKHVRRMPKSRAL
jgi:hypothetical protein